MNRHIIISVLLSVSILGCDSSPNDMATEESKENKKTTYAYKPMVNTWPKLEVEQLALEKNLLANNYYLVLDGSGSMKESKCSGGRDKMYQAKKAVVAFVKQIPANANMGLFVFDDAGANERVALSLNSGTQIVNAINKVDANAGTPLRTAITNGFKALEAQAKKQLGYGEYHLVIITDGEANRREEPDKIVDTILNNSPVVIHTVGFCIEGGHSLNQPGRIDYKQANDPQSLSKGLQDVLAESVSFQSDSFEEQ